MNSMVNSLTLNQNLVNSKNIGTQFEKSGSRKFVVFEEEEEQDCDEASNISTLTFLNFVIASLSAAASLSSNTNSNANANNDNNNNNNLNDNNVNIGSNNNNVNSENMLTFQPMVGKRKRRYNGERYNLFCQKDSETNWISKTAFNALEFFARLETCKRKRSRLLYDAGGDTKYKLCIQQVISEEINRLQLIEIKVQRELSTQLNCRALKISLSSKDYKNFDCPD